MAEDLPPESTSSPTPAAAPEPAPMPFEALSLWEALALLRRAPGPTLRRIFDTARELPETETTGDLMATPTPVEEPAGAQRASGDRPLALLYSAQSLFVFALLALLLLAEGTTPAFQAQQLVLMLWFAANTAAANALWRGKPWGGPALRASQAVLAVLSLLGVLQWASYAGVGAPAYARWAGILAAVNLALGALVAYRTGSARDRAQRPADPLAANVLAAGQPAAGRPPLWIAGVWPYLALLGAWAALALAFAADNILVSRTPTGFRDPDILRQGAPLIYAAIALWLLVALVDALPPNAPQWRRLAAWAAKRRSPADVQEPAPARARVAIRSVRLDRVGRRGRLLARRAMARVWRAAAPSRQARRGDRRVYLGVSASARLLAALTLAIQPVRELGLGAGVALVALWVGGSLLSMVLGAGWQRVMIGQAALLLSLATFEGVAGNRFTLGGVLAWGFSVFFWIAALRDPAESRSADMVARLRAWASRARVWPPKPAFALRLSGTAMALCLIMLVGAFFRLHNLEAAPPQMTSDHVEKLLDAARVFGDLGPAHYPEPLVFFPNNGGREPMQMYLVAVVHRLTGVDYSFALLKLVTALEGIITLPLIYWMGKEIAGRRVGLIAAALLAASYWHTVLSRLGLRIVLTPLFVTLVVVYLVRVMRHNRRSDYLKLGLLLGVGMYAYQALRMAPVFVVIGLALAFLFVARNWRARARYALNFAALVVVAVAVFVPLGRVMLDMPDYFWERTATRITGEENGALIAPLNQFLQNYNVAIWMYNWKSDVQWLHNAPNMPQLDPITGALLVLGVAAWLVRLAHRRDAVDLALVVVVAVMLLPSALALAFPSENPSTTRASGTLPVVYLWAALALDALLTRVRAALRGDRLATLASGGVALALFAGVAGASYDLFFNMYAESYARSSRSHVEVGRVVRGFADSIGSMETAFVVAYPHWLDHRAVGIEAGDINWANRELLLDVRDIHRYLPAERTTALMVLYHQDDTATAEYLRATFPEGYAMRYPVASGVGDKDFYIFTVPPPDAAPAPPIQ